jgi:aminoglycoside phosphotransferase (APT) family kinase protein
VESVTALDDVMLADGLARWLARHHGVDEVLVDEVEHPSAGYSSVTTLLRTRWEGRGGPMVEHIVVRMAPDPPGTFADYDLTVQHAAQRAAAAAGVSIAAPIVTETDSSWLGAPFTVMARVDGRIIGDAPPFDPWLRALGPDACAELHDRFLETLARIHRADIDAAAAGGVPRRDNAAELRHWEEYLPWACGGTLVPTLVDALGWCRAHAPAHADDGGPVLCWGDVRLGNVVFGDNLELRAVLDWDMAVIGNPEHDIAWLTVLETTLTTLSGRRVEGFPGRDGTIARYEELAGRGLHDLEWYETFALLRSTAIMTRIGFLTVAAGHEPAMPVADNPLLDLLGERTADS